MNENKNGAAAPTVKNPTILDRIMAILKMDDAGKFGKFFDYKIKEHERTIEKLKINIKAYKMTYAMTITDINDTIEDAHATLLSVEEDVKLEDIDSNAKMKEFSAVYDGNIKHAELALEKLERNKVTADDMHKEAITAMNVQIAKHQERIRRMTE